MNKQEEREKYDYIRNIYNASTKLNRGDLGMKTRQEIALEIRDLITQVNARVAELEEEGYSVSFLNGSQRYSKRTGKITEVVIEKTVKL